MNLSWTKRVDRLIRAAEEFARQTLRSPNKVKGFRSSDWDACALEGLIGMMMPRSWGGGGESALTTAAVFEALGRGGTDRGLLFAMGAHIFGVSSVLARLGSSEQQSYWGPRLCRGETVAALAVTEPGGGSSIRMATIAEASESGFVLTGEKTFVTNGPNAGLFLVLATTAANRGSMGLSAFLVPRNSPGVHVEPINDTLGMRGAPMARILFQGVSLPDDAMLGRAGSGLAALTIAMQCERSLILAGFLGAAEHDLHSSLVFLSSRRGDHGTLLDNQSTAHRLARIKAKLESARWLLYRGAWALDQGEEPFVAPAIVKLTLSETLVECALDVMRCFGGAGWTDTVGIATAMQDVIGTLSASGTNDVQLNVIASSLRP